jgi:ribose transport system substrate-binding protein
MERRRPFSVGLLVVVAALASLLAACGGESGSATDRTDEHVAGQLGDLVKGDFAPPPTDAPAPAADKDVWIISAWQQVHALAYQAERVTEAAEVLGWQAHTCDGQNNANGGWSGCVRQAVAAGADGLVMLSVDCAPVKQALVEARSKGVKIASFSGFDCDDETQGGGDPLFDAPAAPLTTAPTLAEWYTELGRRRAQVAIAATDGHAKVLHVSFKGITFGEYVAKGFREGIAACDDCEIVDTVEVAATEVPQIRQKFESALVKSPDANVVAVDVDYFFTAGIQPALVAANRPGLTVVGSECQSDDLGYIASGRGEQFCLGTSPGYRAYAAIDALNRAFHNQPPVPAGVGFQLVTSSDNMPPEGEEFEGPVDYVAAYREAWGR